ncbi:MAG: iron-sulfur cluster repair di-iron protein [Actinobacteria bacterium]|nr:iron-sulfur cluster repair di-iron protein [Actinomycetota bacterium]
MYEQDTLAAIVDVRPGATRVLERHRLDYCCGGGRTLADACAEAGIDVEPVLAELARADQAGAAEPAPWTAMTPTQLVDHLEATHHRYLHDELPRLTALVDKVVGVHGDRHPELVRVRDSFGLLRGDLEPHLAKEERILFPMIRQLDAAVDAPAFHCGNLANPIRVMLAEHDRAGELLQRLRTLTDDHLPPADACGSYRALYEGLERLERDTHLHVHKENNVLFPAVVALEAARSHPAVGVPVEPRLSAPRS